jgi:flagellar biosynthesis protein FliQ
MTTGDIVAAVRDMLILTLLLVSPFLGVAVVASFVVGLLQAGARLNDLTLSFVPRFAATMLVLYLAAPWGLAQLFGFIERAAAAARALGG